MSDDMDLNQKSTEHRCLESLIEVFLFIDGQLDDERAGEIEQHMTHCKKCYGRVEFEKLVKGYIKKRNVEEKPSENVVSAVSKMFETSS